MASTINAKTTGVGGIDASGDASGVLALQTGGTTAVTIDASQNVGIGTSSPSAKLYFGIAISGTAGLNNVIRLYNNATNSFGFGVASGQMTYNSGDAAHVFYQNSATPTERMRIDSSGNLLVGTTSTGFASTRSASIRPPNGDIIVSHASGDTSGNPYMQFGYAGSGIGSITQNGTTGVLYNITSDYRLKNDVAPIQNALTTIEALNPVSFTWIDGRPDDGFLAHELQAVIPNCVTGEKDAVNEDGTPKYQQMDNSGVIPFLVKAIQELKAIIDIQQQIMTDLNTRITALENKIV